jgi:hypothetical protein
MVPQSPANYVDASLREELVNYCAQRIADTEFSSEPFPHFVVAGFFPEDIYSELVENLPDQNQYEAFGYERHHDAEGESNRFRYQFSNASLQQLTESKRRLWYTVRSVLGSSQLKQAVFSKLSPGLKLRYGANKKASDLSGFALPELFRETEGYTIKPHPDTRKKVVTMQFALATDLRQKDLGTEFYKRSVDPRCWLRQPYGFEIAKRMPFTPNTVYAFSVLNTVRLKSWHGRTVIPGDFGVRNSLLNIWYEEAQNANRELVEDARWFDSRRSPSRNAA